MPWLAILLLFGLNFTTFAFSQQCNTTNDCPPGLSCSGSQCQVNTKCITSYTCPPGSYCSNSFCYPISCSDTGQCIAQTCDVNTNRCLPNQCSYTGSGNDCPPPFICPNAGQCIPGVAFCFNETDCPVDFFCLCGRCVPFLCMINEDCLRWSGSSQCQNGNCLPLTGYCTSCSQACPPLYACSNDGVCVFTNQTNAPTFQPTPSFGPTTAPPPTITPSPTLPTAQPSFSVPTTTTISPTSVTPTSNTTTNDQDKLNVGIFLILYIILIMALLILFIGYRTYRKNSTPK